MSRTLLSPRCVIHEVGQGTNFGAYEDEARVRGFL